MLFTRMYTIKQKIRRRRRNETRRPTACVPIYPINGRFAVHNDDHNNIIRAHNVYERVSRSRGVVSGDNKAENDHRRHISLAALLLSVGRTGARRISERPTDTTHRLCRDRHCDIKYCARTCARVIYY